MIGPEASDAAVLAYLRAATPGTVTVRHLAEKTGLPRVTARTSVIALADSGLVCVITDPGESAFMVRHVHAAPGACEHSLSHVIIEDPA